VDAVALTDDARLDVPSTIICTGFTSQEYKDAIKDGSSWLRRLDRGAERDLDRPAHESLADVVASKELAAILSDITIGIGSTQAPE
jgi:hypothetical protein